MARIVVVILMLAFTWPSSTHAIVLEDLIENGELELVLNHKKIGYYIGSFDPLHKGHEGVTVSPIKQGLCDFVIIYPSWGGDSYKVRADVQLRLDMLFAMFRDHPNIIVTRLTPQKLQEVLTVSDVSEALKNTKKIVRPAFEGMRFIGIIGSDIALKLDENVDSTFMTGRKISKKYAEHTGGGCMALPVDSFIVSVRGNDDLNPLGGKVLNKKIIAITEEEYERTMSSTAVKMALRADETINSIVSEPVITIIEKYGLYR